MISVRHKLHRNNYPQCITSAPRNLDRVIEDGTRNLTTVCLPYVKGLAERIQKNIVYMTLGQYSQLAQLSGGISSVSSHQQNSTKQRTVCTPSLAVVVQYTKMGNAAN